MTQAMEILRTPSEMRDWSRDQIRAGSTVALVPTMGCFHEGHLSLMRMACRYADKVVVSLFVNPIQFGPSEDFEAYPRDFERDSELARRNGVDLLFAPLAEAMYPPGFQTSVSVGELSRHLCGASRPGHFDGVATVVCKLFHLVSPRYAVFGAKDFQQLAIIRRLVQDLDFDITILAHPIVREPDGLAMSSRNRYLDSEQRRSARCLFQGISLARTLFRRGERCASDLVEEVTRLILGYPDTQIDYVQCVDQDTLRPVTTLNRNTLLALAVLIGKRVRLIDNGLLAEEQ